MVEPIKKEEAKKELDGIVSKEKESIDKAKEATMTDAEKKKSEEDKAKAEEVRLAAEKKAKEDEDILAKKDDELSEDQKKRKSELLKKKQEEEESKLSTEEKIKKVKDSAQKRIDEISGQLKAMEDKNSKEAEQLRKSLETLESEKEALEKKIDKTSGDDDDVGKEILASVKKAEKERIAKELEEDKDKSREERREMTKEELSDWLAEDFGEANEWLSERTLRRDKARNKSLRSEQEKRFVDSILEAHNKSATKTYEKHPELNTTKRIKELEDEGKTKKEIFEVLCKENEKWRICSEIVKEDPKIYREKNAPELIVAEMEKRLENKGKKSETSEKIEKLEKLVEDQAAEIAKLQSDDEGITSNTHRTKLSKEKVTELETTMLKTMKDVGLPQDKIDSALKKFREKHKKV